MTYSVSSLQSALQYKLSSIANALFRFRYLLSIFFILSITLPPPSLAFSVSDTDVFENFDSNTNFKTKIMGDHTLAEYSISNSLLEIDHKPRNFYNSYKVYKKYQADLSQTTWFHFRFKMKEYLLGQDMYTTLTFYKDNDPNQPMNLTVGINSEQHWKTNYFSGRNIPCEAKQSDDQFFLAVSPELFPNARDVRIRYPSNYTKKYTDWTLFSIKYDKNKHNFSFFIDGHLVDNLRPIDSGSNAMPINTTTQALNNLSQTNITFSATTLIDGREYSYTGNKYGNRGRGCYTPITPAIPSGLTYPTKFSNNDGLQFKTQWMKDFDSIANIMVQEIQKLPTNPKFPPLLNYQIPRSATSPLPQDFIPTTNPTQFYESIPVYINDQTNVKHNISNRIWAGIYDGTIDLETAIEMGAIPLPDISNNIWQYNSPTLRQEIINVLEWQQRTYRGIIPLAKSFVWKKVFSIGNIADIVHFGYLTPEDAYSGNALNHSSKETKKTIPLPATPKISVFYWDYFLINRNLLPDDIPPQKELLSDLNQDGKVNIFDYNILVAGFGTKYDIFDYNELVANYGK